MLAELITAELFPFLLVFVRIGAALMLLPPFGEAAVPRRIRLHLALVITVVVTPMLRDNLPAMPAGAAPFALLIIGELVVGAFFGLSARLILTALHVAGMIYAFQSSLAAALLFDPNQSGRTALAGNFLNLTVLLLIFATDMHHLLLRGLLDSYMTFPPGGAIPTADSATAIAHLVSNSFRVGFELAAPIIVAGFLIYLGSGLLNRLMPQMMVFFVVLPIQITVGFLILMISLSAIMFWFLSYFSKVMVNFPFGF